jgi:hypothetical protein
VQSTTRGQDHKSRTGKFEDLAKAHSKDPGSREKGGDLEMRNRGQDVAELLHDGHPTACVGEAAFGYVDMFSSHVTSASFTARPWTIRQSSCKELEGSCVT